MKSNISVLFIVLISFSILSAQPDTLWTRIDLPGWDVLGVETDSLNNIFVCGFADNSSWRLIKYSPAGAMLWAKNFDYTLEGPQDIVISHQGSIIFTGQHNGAILVVKCDSYGDTIWTRTYDSGNPNYEDHAYAVTADGAGNIAVAGYVRNAGEDAWDYIVLKYGPAGNLLWFRKYSSGGSDQAYGIAADPDSNLYVTGGTDQGIVTIKYGPQGDTVWTRIYSNSFCATDMVLDNNGDLIVISDKIIKYNSAGDTVWVNDDPSIHAFATDIDLQNNIYVTATQNNNDSSIIVTSKYSTNGDSIWSVIYDAFAQVSSDDIKIDPDGNIIVGGFRYDSVGDFLTIKYNAETSLEEKKDAGDPSVGFDCSIFPNPTAGAAEIRFHLSNTSFIKIDIFDIIGRVVDRLFEGNVSIGYHVVQWQKNDCPAIPAGIYFCRLKCNDASYFKKIVIDR